MDVRLKVLRLGQTWVRTDNRGFAGRNARDGDQEEGEEDGEDGEAFGGASLALVSIWMP